MNKLLLKRRRKRVRKVIGYKEHITKVPYMNHTEEIVSMIAVYED